jgi:hypothetical protein
VPGKGVGGEVGMGQTHWTSSKKVQKKSPKTCTGLFFFFIFVPTVYYTKKVRITFIISRLRDFAPFRKSAFIFGKEDFM